MLLLSAMAPVAWYDFFYKSRCDFSYLWCMWNRSVDNIPKCSMYGIFTYFYPKNHPNVGKYSVHGACGYYYLTCFKYVFITIPDWHLILVVDYTSDLMSYRCLKSIVQCWKPCFFMVQVKSCWIKLYNHLGKLDHDLTVLPHWKSWLVRKIIPKWPNYSG